MCHRITRIKGGGINPDIKVECIVTALTKEIRTDFTIVNIKQTKVVNFAELVLTLWLAPPHEEEYKRLIHRIVCMERKLNMAIEWSYPLCYICEESGHMKENCKNLDAITSSVYSQKSRRQRLVS